MLIIVSVLISKPANVDSLGVISRCRWRFVLCGAYVRVMLYGAFSWFIFVRILLSACAIPNMLVSSNLVAWLVGSIHAS